MYMAHPPFQPAEVPLGLPAPLPFFFEEDANSGIVPAARSEHDESLGLSIFAPVPTAAYQNSLAASPFEWVPSCRSPPTREWEPSVDVNVLMELLAPPPGPRTEPRKREGMLLDSLVAPSTHDEEEQGQTVSNTQCLHDTGHGKETNCTTKSEMHSAHWHSWPDADGAGLANETAHGPAAAAGSDSDSAPEVKPEHVQRKPRIHLVECGPVPNRRQHHMMLESGVGNHMGWACTPSGQLVRVVSSTAIRPNRARDKRRVEATLGLPEFGNSCTEFYAARSNNLLIARGYDRVVYGDHGPYVEFSVNHVISEAFPNIMVKPPSSYYDECFTADGETMLYAQKRTVKKKPNPPKGRWSVANNCREGYANYLVGKFYMSCDADTLTVVQNKRRHRKTNTTGNTGESKEDFATAQELQISSACSVCEGSAGGGGSTCVGTFDDGVRSSSGSSFDSFDDQGDDETQDLPTVEESLMDEVDTRSPDDMTGELNSEVMKSRLDEQTVKEQIEEEEKEEVESRKDEKTELNGGEIHMGWNRSQRSPVSYASSWRCSSSWWGSGVGNGWWEPSYLPRWVPKVNSEAQSVKSEAQRAPKIDEEEREGMPPASEVATAGIHASDNVVRDLEVDKETESSLRWRRDEGESAKGREVNGKGGKGAENHGEWGHARWWKHSKWQPMSSTPTPLFTRWVPRSAEASSKAEETVT